MKIALGTIATLMALVAYAFYFRDILKGRTRPHAFTWLVWAALTAVAFAAQLDDGGGAGSWVTGFTAAASLAFFVLSLTHGEKDISRSDWLCLVGAALAALLWAVTDNALLAVILVCVIDGLGFAPTIRKSYFKPTEETLITYLLSGLKFILALIALENFSAITALYPASLVLLNLGFVVMLVIRRAALT